MVSITHAPLREIVVTGLISFNSQQNLASMVASVVNVSGQSWKHIGLKEWFSLLILQMPRLSHEEYVNGKICTSKRLSRAQWPSKTVSSGVRNTEVAMIDVSSNVGLRDGGSG